MKESQALENARAANRARLRKDWVLPVSLAGLILGMLLALQFSSQKTAGEFAGLKRAELLAQLLASEKTRAQQMENQIAKLREEQTEYAKAATQEKELLALLNKDIERYKLALGLTPAHGRGIVLRVEDSQLVREAGPGAELFLIHDSDLLPIVNELRAAGAEAISINNERVVGSTAIRCVGPVVNVNSKGIAAPYEIKAIGSPQDLKGALEIKDGIIDRLKAAKFPVNLEIKDDVFIPGLSVSPEFKYAKAAKEPKEQ